METPHDDHDLDFGPEPESPPAAAHDTVPYHRPRRRALALAVAAAMSVSAVAGFAIERASQSPSTAVSTAASSSTSPTTGASTATATLTLQQIEAKVDPALVDITAKLGGSSTAEGTGMVVSSTGEILTNNHVISGATSISVTISGTGTSYRASVVGYDVTDDVAVLQIPHVSGLTTITTASASTVSVNDAIVALGNALGKGGTPAAAQGSVSATDQTITASDDTGAAQETLTGLIQITAAVEPGDSGGATVNAHGQVVGMTTAASSSGYQPMSTSAGTTAFAIPIDKALSIARTIESGSGTATVHIGEHGLLGVQIDAGGGFGGSAGATVVGVQSGSAAASAGVTAGSAIVAIDGHTISSAADLNDALAATHVGDKVTITWQDGSGQSHTATATLKSGVA